MSREFTNPIDENTPLLPGFIQAANDNFLALKTSFAGLGPPSDLEVGQIYYDEEEDAFRAEKAGGIRRITPVISDTAPSSPSVGDIWIDTAALPGGTAALKFWNDDEWEAALAGLVDLKSDVTNILPVGNGGTNSNNAAGAQANLGLLIGSDVQAHSSLLSGLSTVVTSANSGIYATGVNTFDSYPLTAYARTLLDDSDAATARGTLGLGTIATQNAESIYVDLVSNGEMDLGALADPWGGVYTDKIVFPNAARTAELSSIGTGVTNLEFNVGPLAVGERLVLDGSLFAPDGFTPDLGGGTNRWGTLHATDIDLPNAGEIAIGDAVAVRKSSNTFWLGNVNHAGQIHVGGTISLNQNDSGADILLDSGAFAGLPPNPLDGTNFTFFRRNGSCFVTRGVGSDSWASYIAEGDPGGTTLVLGNPYCWIKLVFRKSDRTWYPVQWSNEIDFALYYV